MPAQSLSRIGSRFLAILANVGRVEGGDSTEFHRQRVVGIGAVSVAQLMDVFVTIVGVSQPGIVEVNPIALAAMDVVGTVFGLLLLSLVIIPVIAMTETAAHVCRGTSMSPLYVRYLGYGPLTVVSLAAVVYNLHVISVA